MVLRIVSDGIYYALGLLVAAVVLTFLINPWLTLPLYVLAAFCLYFFRDPERVPPQGDVMVAPADGKVVALKATGPHETRISIFLNIFNVHVNRAMWFIEKASFWLRVMRRHLLTMSRTPS